MDYDAGQEALTSPEDTEKSSTNEAELVGSNKTNEGTGKDLANLYSGAGCYPPYPCSQGTYNPLYSDQALLSGAYPYPPGVGGPRTFLGRPSYPGRYPYQGYQSRYNIYGNTFRYPRYPFRYGQNY